MKIHGPDRGVVIEISTYSPYIDIIRSLGLIKIDTETQTAQIRSIFYNSLKK